MRFIIALLPLLICGSLAAQEKPNILLILADDLGWSDLGCYGSSCKNTPALDRLASEGIRFTQACAAQPICSPSRAAIMTGRAPARLHFTDFIPGRRVMPSQRMLRPDMNQQLPLEEETLAELLKKSGYTSAIFGKWHLGGEGFGPLQQGFDHCFAGNAATTPTNAEGGKGEYELTARACEWMEQNRDKPFFCYIAHNTPHIPLGAKKDLEDKYRKTGEPNPTYAAMLESLDDCVRLTLEKLEALQLNGKTMVIFLSDNGGLSVVEGVNTPATRNRPLRGGKGGLYEGGLRIPLIIRWPGTVPAGKIENTPVINTDLVPTLLAATGAAAPSLPLDGVNLLPLIQRRGDLKRPALFWHYPHYSNQRGFPGGAMRSGDWKFIESYDDGHLELYHLAEDPSELQNLALSMPSRVAEMKKSLHEWRESCGAQMMKPNPDYDPSAAWNLIFQAANGSLTLPASLAEVHGSMLRYEPPPNKNTLGYWTRAEDWASWDVKVEQPGDFRVILRHGCGNGSGGSEVEITAAGKSLPFTVTETGGFQNWVETGVGTVTLPAGRHTLAVRPKTKKGGAVMDIQRIVLQPVKQP
ncbi:MAG TPA: sulfatase-like hydrolase/transferase [Verrucomicrobiales bacterium]|nr:sulfatase-like hydrolase/transferase [Verrucomicrobiales bacterium]